MVGPCIELGSVTTLLHSLLLCELKRREGMGTVCTQLAALIVFWVIIRSSRGLTIPQSGVRCGVARDRRSAEFSVCGS